MMHFLAGLACACWLVGAAHGQTEQPPTPTTVEVRLHGRVVTWDGQPIANAALRYEPAKQASTAELLRAPHATTDAEGRFAFVVKAPPERTTDTPVLFVAAKGLAARLLPVPWQRKGAVAAPQAQEDVDASDGSDVVEADAAGVWVPNAGPRKFEYAAETSVGDLVLAAGHRLFGRVRDAAGKPLAGVRVVAEDMLEQGNSFRSNRSLGFFSAAVSDAAGIFDLPCALPFGSRLTFQMDGYYRERLEPVAAGSPLEMTMRPSGWIQGRILDPDGRSIAGADVAISYEQSSNGESTQLRTAADGSFRTGLERPGRWRASATRREDNRSIEGHSAVFVGPRENFEVIAKIGEAAAQQRIPVRVVDKKTSQPVPAFKVAAVWEEYANQNANYLEYRFRWQMREAPLAKDGTAEINGPGTHGTSVGALRVIAPGFAPATKKQVEWKEPEAGQHPEAIIVELEAEATLRGVVLDESSGKPVVGARVFARLHQDPNQGVYDDGNAMPADAPTTAADGTFHLTGLGEGNWDLIVRDPKRPRCPPKEVELTAAEQKSGISIQVPSGAVVAGKLTNTTIAHGTKVFLAKLPRQTFGESNQYYSNYNSGQTGADAIAVAPDGSFRFEGVALDNHLLVVRLPSPPRHGGDLYLPIEPFRVRAAGIQRDFDCREDRPGTIRGKLSFSQATVPFDQLVVVARLVGEEGRQFFSPFDISFPGPRSFVTPTGDYELRVGPGSYQLLVVDLATSIQLHDEAKKVEVAAGGTVERELKPELTRIELELKTAADVKEMAAVDRIEVRILSKALKESGMQFGANDSYDAGGGLRWPVGQTKHTVVLPLGEATFLCRNGIAQLRIDDERWNNAPLGRAELEITIGQGAKTGVVIEVGGPPEIPDPDKEKKAEAEEGAADETVPASDAKKKDGQP